MGKIVVVAGYGKSLVIFRGELISSWLAQGHQVVAAAPGEEARAGVEALGAGYVEIPLSRTGMNPLADMGTFRALRHMLRRERPEYLFLYTAKPVIYGSLAARGLDGCRVFSLITGLGYVFSGESRKQRLVRRLTLALYRGALARNRRVFFQNPDDRATFLELDLVEPAQTALVNGSGVSLEHFARAPLPGTPVTFLLIARLLWDKGIREYVEAARKIKGEFPRARFLLVGPLDENPSAIGQADVDEWVREGAVEYLGPQEDVRPCLARSHVYVLPSYREGTPRTVLEAMATGRPIITTDTPGCRETVQDGVNGYLVPVKDSQALAAAMHRFMAEPRLIAEMGTRSRELVENKYDVHQVNRVINEAMGLIASDSPDGVDMQCGD